MHSSKIRPTLLPERGRRETATIPPTANPIPNAGERAGKKQLSMQSDIQITNRNDTCFVDIEGVIGVPEEWQFDQPSSRVATYEKFREKYQRLNQKYGKNQYLVPYLMSSHLGSTLKDAVYLAEYLYKNHMRPEQVQDFIPTPGSASTAMYYSGINPETGKKVFVARNPHDKAMQRALMQYKNPKNRQLVKEALQQTNRGDLIGDDAKCLLKISSSHNPKARHSKIAFNPKINKRR